MKERIWRWLIRSTALACAVLAVGCDVDDDFFEDGHLTDAIYAFGDVTVDIIRAVAVSF